jgi:FlaA1/EpsC-like NDP-sugar epimerase
MDVGGRPDMTAFGMANTEAITALSRSLARLGSFAVSRRRATKRGIVMLVDAGLCAAACFLSVFLRLGFFPDRDTPFALMIAVSIALALPIFLWLGLYREIFSQSGLRAITAIAWACVLYTIPFATVFTFISVWGIPRTVSLIQPILLFVAIAGSRMLARYWLAGVAEAGEAPRRRVIIYGAGAAGRQLAGAIAQSRDMAVVGFFDDDPALIGRVLDGRKIFAPVEMARTVARLGASEVLLAVPSAPHARRREIIAAAGRARVRIRTLPGLMDLADGKVDVRLIRDVEVEDLLGRECVEPDIELMRRHIRGKTVMVTGAGGSIGGELCRKLLALEPALLLLVDINEFGLYEIHRELTQRVREADSAARVIPLLGSVCDEARLCEIVGGWLPNTVYHAAAYKHVPLVEQNPAEGVRVNVLGTFTMASVAARFRVQDFILVSTDKAVRPTNVMGATKRAAELVLQAFNEASPSTRFAMVRFGNVLGTSGSVVPLFKQQIRAGGPVTVTDRRVTRYFMTASEAAELVLQAGAMARGGEVFVLDMGKPVRIMELAQNMIELAGLSVKGRDNPDGDIEVVEIGLRPGEKLFEELLIGDDPSPTDHPRILKADERFLSFDALIARLDRIARLLDAESRADLIMALRDLVPEFQNEGGVADWVYAQALGAAPIRVVPRAPTIAVANEEALHRGPASALQ